MKKILAILTAAAFVALVSAMALADTTPTRDMADSEYRIAEKAYRSAVEKYGRNISGMPADEKATSCQKVRWALYDNRIQYTKEDLITQMRFKRQIQKLEEFKKLMGCE
ncbi:MAG: hypothetical protein V3571_05290 [Pseudodesulfovibrio sp.]